MGWGISMNKSDVEFEEYGKSIGLNLSRNKDFEYTYEITHFAKHIWDYRTKNGCQHYWVGKSENQYCRDCGAVD